MIVSHYLCLSKFGVILHANHVCKTQKIKLCYQATPWGSKYRTEWWACFSLANTSFHNLSLLCFFCGCMCTWMCVSMFVHILYFVLNLLPLRLMWAESEEHNQNHTKKKYVLFLFIQPYKTAVKKHRAWGLTLFVWWWFPMSLAAWFEQEASLPSSWGEERAGGFQDYCW